MKKANPGSDEAVIKGCTCPVIDNSHGRGAYLTENGQAMFWNSDDCPIHGTKDEIEPDTEIVEDLAQAHWEYVERVIRNEYDIEFFDTEYCDSLKFHYITAFVHGYKHGREA